MELPFDVRGPQDVQRIYGNYGLAQSEHLSIKARRAVAHANNCLPEVATGESEHVLVFVQRTTEGDHII